MPEISVIVTAHDRKTFLIQAVDSVLSQNVDKSVYEIIVSKNFEDEYIDQYLREKGVICILDKVVGMGFRLANAVRYANGNIICFLQDDDLWKSNKLEFVRNNFRSENLGLLRDEVEKIDSNGIHIKQRCRSSSSNLRVQYGRNDLNKIRDVFVPCGKGLASAISMSVKLVPDFIRIAPQIYYAIDDWMIYCCLDSTLEYRSVTNVLTVIRVHGTASHIIDANIYPSKLRNFLRLVIKDEDLILLTIQSKELKIFINAERARNIITLFINAREEFSVSNLVSALKGFLPFLFHNRNISNLFLIFFGMLSIYFSRFTPKVINKLIALGISGSI